MRFGLAIVFCLAGLTLAAPAWAAPGLVAAYGFDDGSGTTAVDASGNGRAGAVVGATWSAGRYGGALTFDGTNDYVGLPALGTFYNTAFTLEAWVQKASTKNDVAIVGSWAGDGPMLWIDHLATRYHVTLGGTLPSYLDSGVNPATGQWQHLAATFNGTTARFYVDGAEVASRTVSQAVGTSNTWRIGAYGSVAGGFFDGVIDEIRVYDRALSTAEVQTDMSTPLGIANPGAPTAPGNLTVTGSTETTISLGWTASTDDTGVSGYRVYSDGNLAGTTAATSFTITGLACSTGHQLEVEAFDAEGNTSPRASVSGSTTSCGTTPGLVAAYAFDEGSGSALNDASGNGKNGTISGASWVTGHTGSALSFDGTDDHVALASLGTFYNSAFTLEAWVRKATTKKDVAVVGSWTGSGPMLWIDHVAGHHYATLGSSLSSYLDSGQSPIVGQWQHLAATFDGTTARYYIDGAQVASQAVSGAVGTSNTWRIGAYGTSLGGFFDGTVDDVRVYNRALSAGEVVFDRDHGVTPPGTPPDTTPPSAPGTLTATGGLGQASLSWGAASDNIGVVRYNVHRATTSGFTPSTSNRIAQPTGVTYTDSGLAAGTYYYKVTAEDGAGNVGPASNEASATVTVADTTLPNVSITAPASGATVSGVTAINATATDNVAVAGVQFRVDGANVGAEDLTAPYSLSWDTIGVVNGSHALTALARDTSGNTRTSSSVPVTVANAGVSPAGLRVAYALNETSGTVVADSSGNTFTATAVGSTWAAGHFGGAASLDGVNDRIDVPALGTFYTAAFTYEAWVRKQTSKKDVAVFGSWSNNGPMIWVDHIAGRYYLTLGSSMSSYLDSGRTPTLGQWEHVAATYNGSVARFYIGGVEVASTSASGIGSSNTWRLGAYGGTPTGFFDGLIDNVRVYDRALSASEINTDMTSPIQGESIPPTVTAKTPADGSAGVSVGTTVTAKFNEPMAAASITSTTFQLKNASNVVVPAAVSYNATTQTATLTPQSALAYGTTYTANVKGGTGGVADVAGNALAASVLWSFTAEASAPQVLIVTSTAKPFGSYLAEILRNEGLNAFTTVDITFISPALLSGFDVVLLGEMALNASQVSTLTGWVNGGGNLVAMRPDAKLAGLLGITSPNGSRSNAYLKVNTAVAPGAGITSATMQYHGAADRYALNGATAVATQYSNSTTVTSNPAVTLRSVGSSGGQAAAFTYDLPRSVVYTRQGNPAWASQQRDGQDGMAPNDLFYGGAAGDPQPDWIDTNKIGIPQADEQQRLLLNLITVMTRDRLPVPRFWYLPRGEKAAVAMSSDDHSATSSSGGSAYRFDRYKALSPAGCLLSEWECVRATTYIYPESSLTSAQASSYNAEGFEIGLHPVVASCPTTSITQAELATFFDSQLTTFRNKYTGIPSPVSNRTHCYYWPDWASSAKVELASGIRMDANYSHIPPNWIGAKPGFLTGGGFPMRFADVNGNQIDVYQQNTNLTDDGTSEAQTPGAIASLLDNAVGAPGYYGAFGVLMHADESVNNAAAEAIVAAAQARSVPVISYKQLLTWVDGRNASTIRGLRWTANGGTGGTFSFVTTVAAGANGLQTMLPTQGPTGTLSAITRGGTPVSYTLQTIKGIQYAFFTAASAAYQATYS